MLLAILLISSQAIYIYHHEFSRPVCLRIAKVSSSSPSTLVFMDAVRLYEQLRELEEKRDALRQEVQAQGTPQEERERLLKAVKEDNNEIASMERQ